MAKRARNDRKRKLGAFLKARREALGMSQAAVAAAALNDLSQTDISKIESGLRWPSVPQLAGILRVLGAESTTLAQLTDDAREGR